VIIGGAVGACLGQTPPPIPPVTYTVNNEDCGHDTTAPKCGTCTTTWYTNSGCASGYECVGFKCDTSTATYTACSSGGQAGNCQMSTGTADIGCTNCQYYEGDPLTCIDSGTCGSPGCSGTGQNGIGNKSASCT
jgi:hypothetical protein